MRNFAPRTLSLALSFALAAGIAAAAPPTAFVGATVFDGTGSDPVADAVILVSGERVEAVGPRAEVKVPESATVVDVSGRWIVPGLIDAHIHYFQSGGIYTRPDIVDLREVRSYSEEMTEVEAHLDGTFRRYLASGVTSVVDVGGGYWNFKVRERANATLLAPRTAVAGPLVSTVSRPQMDIGDPPIIKADTPEMARQMVRDQLAYAPDLIKIWFIVPRDGNVTANLDIIQATVDEAHAAGKRVAIHATQLEAARASVKAGAEILVHSVDDQPVDQELVDLVVAKGVIYTSTLIVKEGYAEVLGRGVDLLPVEKELGDPDVIATWSELDEPLVGSDFLDRAARRREQLPESMKIMQANLKVMQDAGAIVAAGTDAGNIGTLHGPAIHRELELMAEAGLTPREILVDVTRNAARVFAAEPEIGTLEQGKLADMLILDADPLADVANLQRIHRVVKGGQVLDPAIILPPTPETVVQRQVDAYNARDIDRFLSFYADDATITRLPQGEVVAAGREALQARYAARFDTSPQLHCRVMQRTVSGNWVVDHEFVTGMAERPRTRVVVAYEVKDGLIRSVWMLPQEE